jgi:hypothetical protein
MIEFIAGNDNTFIVGYVIAVGVIRSVAQNLL